MGLFMSGGSRRDSSRCLHRGAVSEGRLTMKGEVWVGVRRGWSEGLRPAAVQENCEGGLLGAAGVSFLSSSSAGRVPEAAWERDLNALTIVMGLS